MDVDIKFMLIDGKIVKTKDLLLWGRWMEKHSDRVIERTTVDGVDISTVFLGLDHNWGGNGPPILFETMIFGGEHDEYCDRCATLAQARKMHTRALWLVRGSKEVAGGAM